MGTENRGEKVILRCFQDKAVVKVIHSTGWYKTRHRHIPKVFVTSAVNLAAEDAGEGHAMAIGWPPEDVFEYDESVDLENVDWSKLTQWKSKTAA
jgi:hypothetical protein